MAKLLINNSKFRTAICI